MSNEAIPLLDVDAFSPAIAPELMSIPSPAVNAPDIWVFNANPDKS